jgi:ATP-dependent Clp protease ATP-binding subunit ClpC
VPKINVYLPDELALAVREARLPVSAICQHALERALRDVESLRGAGGPLAASADAAPADEPTTGRFTPRARQVLVLAEQVARAASHDHVDTEHLLLGILDEGDNLGIAVLDALDIELDDLRAELTATMHLTKAANPPPDGPLPRTPAARRALDHTANEALTLGHNYVGCEHLLLGLLATEDGLASQVLRRMGGELRASRRAVTAVLTEYLQRGATRTSARRPTAAALDEIRRRLDTLEQKLGG